VVEVTTKIIFGSQAAVQARFVASPVSQTINTSFVAHNNLTCRSSHGRLARKVLSFSKELTWLEKHLWLSLAYYHFVLAPDSLRQRCSEPQPTWGSGSPKRWQPSTPAMAAGITDHVWTMEELLSSRVPPDFRDQLDQQATNATSSRFHTRYRETAPKSAEVRRLGGGLGPRLPGMCRTTSGIPSTCHKA